MKKLQPTLTSGFTLIELLIVASLAAVIMITVSALFMTFLIGSGKTNQEQRIKTEGNYALRQMEYILRNAQGLEDSPVCAAGMISIAVRNTDDTTTTLELLNNKIAVRVDDGAAVEDLYLTSDYGTASGLTFDCAAGANDTTYVGISFSLKSGTATQPGKDTVIEQFTSGVTLRN